MGSAVKAPEEHVSEFRDRHGLGNAPIRDIIQVVEDYAGAFVLAREFPASYDAFTAHDDVSGTIVIAVGISNNYERQRFSVAHELGHLESGRMSADVHSLPDAKRSPDEKWADGFARHLLLPISAVDKYLTDVGRTKGSLTLESVSDLVRVFGVSPAVAMIQLRDSQWICQDNYDLWTQSSPSLTSRSLAVKFGWASERDGLVRATQTPRRPTRIVKAATSAYQEGKITLEALAQVSGENDLDSFQSLLEESGIHSLQVITENDTDRELEDLSDLYRESH